MAGQLQKRSWITSNDMQNPSNTYADFLFSTMGPYIVKAVSIMVNLNSSGNSPIGTDYGALPEIITGLNFGNFNSNKMAKAFRTVRAALPYSSGPIGQYSNEEGLDFYVPAGQGFFVYTDLSLFYSPGPETVVMAEVEFV